MSSAAKVFTTRSPISLTHWKSKKAMRSPWGSRTSMSLPPARCLRSSIQKEGGVWGFSKVSSVRQTRAEPDRADTNSLYPAVRVRICSTTSSRVGSKILSILACSRISFSSPAVRARVAASSAIGHCLLCLKKRVLTGPRDGREGGCCR